MRKLVLIYIALTMALAPAISNAKTKHKVSTAKYTLNKSLSSKYKVTKFKSSVKATHKSSRIKVAYSPNMHVKLRKQAQPVYEASEPHIFRAI